MVRWFRERQLYPSYVGLEAAGQNEGGRVYPTEILLTHTFDFEAQDDVGAEAGGMDNKR